ncbi:MAG TPA: ABC transporter permease subunit [Candidatus Hydrogenedentes bacterium]|nr:ABC transporter permease subunit [Candidatus Hydrogenedentota bacterium]HOJ67376.1 ABC transporter permease subunit [Candidatus Hydrogenedentota bacterium]HOK88764.1 ABC transporter permease subunit [Candidatus Hydrogenedentota bacterium]HOV60077.1 ABC transporter permease subunit [Candidatus Hydrogenedentota bacterium]
MKQLAGVFRGPWAIAVYTYREGIRKRTLIGFLILSLLVIFGSSFISAFLDPTSRTDIELKLIKDICVATISIFGALITVFTSASVVPNEVENKVIYSILSKPIRRWQYLLGKFLGAQLIIIVNLALMGILFFAALYIRQGVMPTLLLWALLLTYFEFLILSAFTFAISTAATSPVLPTIGGLFVYITGNLTEYLKDVQNRAGQTGKWLDDLLGQIAGILYDVLPNLQNFSLRNQIVNGMPNDPPTDVMIPNLVAYGLIWAIGGFLLAWLIFWRKEL